MLDEFKIHNLFWEDTGKFAKEDPNLSVLTGLKFVHPLDWWRKIDWEKPGIFILTGGRQIGKSTSTKLLVRHVLDQNRFTPQAIFYLTCDRILDARELDRFLRFFLHRLPAPAMPFLLVIDEITYVREWSRIIKALADEGWFRFGFCILTGSDTVILKEAASSFPGRRGDADQTDFHLLPLGFTDYVRLVDSELLTFPEQKLATLFQRFADYLECGGFLRAINDWHRDGHIHAATYATFEQWIRGDFVRRGKSETHLAGLFQSLIEVGISQASFATLTERLALFSKETFMTYFELLERMDIVFTLQAFDQNTRQGFPKKARKFHFSDPFLLHVIENWLKREGRLSHPTAEGNRVESVVAACFHRLEPLYYIKAEGEIDLVRVHASGFMPIEVKWTRQLRPGDLKQLKKYPQSIILTKIPVVSAIDGICAIPLPLYLIQAGV